MSDYIYYVVKPGSSTMAKIDDWQNKIKEARLKRVEVVKKYGAINSYGNQGAIIGLSYSDCGPEGNFAGPKLFRKTVLEGITLWVPNKRNPQARAVEKEFQIEIPDAMHLNCMLTAHVYFQGSGNGRGGMLVHFCSLEYLASSAVLGVPAGLKLADGISTWCPPADDVIELKMSEYYLMKEAEETGRRKSQKEVAA